MKTVIAFFISLMLTSCASWFKSQAIAPTVEETTKAAFLDRTMAAVNVPLLKITCLPSCTFASLELGNPFAVSQLGDTAKVVFAPQRSEWGENYRATLGAVAPLLGYGIIGNAAAKIMGKVTEGFTAGFASNAHIAGFGFEANGNIASFIPQPGAVTTTTLSGQGVIGSGQYIGPVQTSTVTNPNPRVCGYSGTPPTFTCIGG